MSEPGAEAIDKLVQHEVAVVERFFVFENFRRDGLQELRLHFAECFGRIAAGFGQFGIGFLPLVQLVDALLLAVAEVIRNLLETSMLNMAENWRGSSDMRISLARCTTQYTRLRLSVEQMENFRGSDGFSAT